MGGVHTLEVARYFVGEVEMLCLCQPLRYRDRARHALDTDMALAGV
jgi:hypothetical protein